MFGPVYLLVLVLGNLARADEVYWKTLEGKPPLVIARGGFSGLFPDSSSTAYEWAGLYSLPSVLNWCDLQLTKDNVGICFPHIDLQTGSNIELIYNSRRKSHMVNNVAAELWLSVDYTFPELSNVTLMQALASRPSIFNNNLFPILKADVVANQSKTNGLWLNVQHDLLFTQNNLNMTDFVLSFQQNQKVAYISSPDLSFLKSIYASTPGNTKLVFSFGLETGVEPSTNMSYDSLLKNLPLIKEFASGIILPKQYIWPVGDDNYLNFSRSIVLEAHMEGLEVFCSQFANDAPYGYDFGYDPIEEYLHFVDNGIFSVDGVISDFPVTPSAAIACYSGVPKDAPSQAKPLVISSGGASGQYAGCTDKAYLQAIADGVDILDCPVQMTKDMIPICLGSINLSNSTNVAESIFNNMTIHVPEIEDAPGIFTFSLTWNQMRALTPSLPSFCVGGTCLPRNPKYATDGYFMTLYEFLDLAKRTNSVSGLLIIIENSSYLARKQNLRVTDSVLAALKDVSHRPITQRVMIQSTEESVLSFFKENSSNYEIVYKVQDDLLDASSLSISDIKKIADSVIISKASVYLQNGSYLTSETNVVRNLHAVNLSVYVQLFRNEYTALAYDYMSDPHIEINTFAMISLVDGVITEYPATAAKYKRNLCLRLAGKTPLYMAPALPGGLRQLRPWKAEPVSKKSTLHRLLRIILTVAVAIASCFAVYVIIKLILRAVGE